MTTVTITTAVAPTAKQLEPLKKALESHIDSKLEYVTVVDPTVLGGIKVQVGSKLYDATVQHKVSQLRSQIIR